MEKIDYSVIIRTTGQAGNKYQLLLNSINNLRPQPKEVIVVLPIGYKIPDEKIGRERFLFCSKGMVNQRMYGINNCKTRYALICDDDVSFEKDFVSKLYLALDNGKYGFSSGPLVDFFPKKGLTSLVSCLTGTACPTLIHKNRYNSVLRTTGFSYSRNIQEHLNYETQTAPWTCFFADIELMKKINFSDEMLWLDKNGYSYKDDQTMFYKAWLLGIKTIIVGNAKYKHLDAKTSTKNNKKEVYYAKGFNIYVFWKRFIFDQEKNFLFKILDIILLYYIIISNTLWNYLNFKRHKINHDEFKTYIEGFNNAKRWVKTEEYYKLGPVRK